MLHYLNELAQAAAHKQLVVFLDYDGTLTPIAPRPEEARLSATMRDALISVAQCVPVAIVSGRGLHDVRQHVNIDALYYAGSHGFEISGPNGFHAVHEAAMPFLPVLDLAETALCAHLEAIPGAQVERKRFAIAVHFRRVDAADVPRVVAVVRDVQQAYPSLRQTGGKKIVELRPVLEWHKGSALFWLLEIMGFDREEVLPIYIGDDLTDEDAFRALQQTGVGIKVTDDASEPTAARYTLADIEAVRTFLTALVDLSKGDEQR